MNSEPVTGVILAGGQSRRFGSDKALFEFDGIPLIQKAHRTLSEVASPVYVSVASSQIHYDILSEHLIDHPGYAGPLAGIHAALKIASSSWVLVLAVDLPHVLPHHLDLLLDARTPHTDAIISSTKDRPQPLCACYHKRTLLTLEALLNQKQFRVSTYLDSINVAHVEFTPKTLTNLNTPTEQP